MESQAGIESQELGLDISGAGIESQGLGLSPRSWN